MTEQPRQTSLFHVRVRDLEHRLDGLRERAGQRENEALAGWVRRLGPASEAPSAAIGRAGLRYGTAGLAAASLAAFLAGLLLGRGG